MIRAWISNLIIILLMIVVIVYQQDEINRNKRQSDIKILELTDRIEKLEKDNRLNKSDIDNIEYIILQGDIK